MKLMDDDEKYKAHLSQMSFVTIADTKFKYVGSGIRNLVGLSFSLFFILVYI